MKRFLKRALTAAGVLFLLVNVIVYCHAYKFTHFYDQGQVSIKTDKEKNGWDRTKEILFGINAVKQPNAAADTAVQQVSLFTSDSIRLDGWYNTVDSAKGTICMFHGHGGKKSGNNAEAAAFRKMGFNTFQIDFRAHGSSEGNTCTIGYEEAEDVKLAYDFIRKKGERNIVLWGASMGASTLVKAIHDYDSIQPSRVILEMPFGTLSDAIVGRLKMMGLPAQPLSTLLTFWGGVQHGFWAFNYKPEDYAKKLQCPALIQWGANDKRVTRREEEAMLANINHKEKKLVVYESSGHESLCTKENSKWISEVSDFLK